MKFVGSILLLALAATAPPRARGDEQAAPDESTVLPYRTVIAAEESAQPVARQILRLLAVGDIDAAARLSNEPASRREVLADYRARVGEEEFRRAFSEYLSRSNRVVAEIAIGSHRLIIWDLAGVGHRVAGQYYVQADGRFLMDDRPSAERAVLRRLLERHRSMSRR